MKRTKLNLFGAISVIALCSAAFLTSCGDEHKHTLLHKDAADATCVSDGNVAYDFCTECGKYFVNNEEVSESDVVIPSDPDNHVLRHINAVAPTCTTNGKIACDVCDECGLIFVEGVEKTSTQIKISATGHNPSDVWSFDDNYHWHECNNEGCSEKLHEESHKKSNENVITAPGLFEGGQTEYTCSDCNKKYTVNTDPIAASLKVEAENCVSNKGKAAIEDNSNASGGKAVTNMKTVGCTFTVVFNASAAADIRFDVRIAKRPSFDINVDEKFSFELNDTAFTMETTLPKNTDNNFFDFITISKKISVVEGTNTVVVKNTTTTTPNLDFFAFASDTITLTEVNPVD